MSNNDNDQSLRDHLVTALDSEHAHLKFDAAVKDFPPQLRGKRPAGGPHSAWELLEHLRITLWDILEFTRNAKHISPDFPKGYWPAGEAPPDAAAWDRSVEAYRRDLEAMAAIVRDTNVDLHAPLAHGEGQTPLREVLLAIDHNAYHLGQLVTVKRLLGG
jgi:hypothetical protein